MKELAKLTVPRGDDFGTIRLLHGDLTALPADAACDVLVVSAFPGNYTPTPRTLIAALEARGVSVLRLAAAKETDLRATSSCWLSRPLRRPDLNIGRILCFEPARAHLAAELVGDVFRSLFPFVAGEPWVRTVAMPLLASGNQGQPDDVILRAMVEAARRWMGAGLTLKRLDIVLGPHKGAGDVEKLREVFRQAAANDPGLDETSGSAAAAHDLFISYSHEDAVAVKALTKELQALIPGIRIFLDSSSLKPGSPWQHEIFTALEASDHVLCLYSPSYLSSKVCLEELHLAILLDRERGGMLIPAFLRNADLPAYMRMIQYVDSREGDATRLTELATLIADRIGAHASVAKAPASGSTSAGRAPAPGRLSVTFDLTQGSDGLRGLLAQLASGEAEVHVNATVRVQPVNR